MALTKLPALGVLLLPWEWGGIIPGCWDQALLTHEIIYMLRWAEDKLQSWEMCGCRREGTMGQLQLPGAHWHSPGHRDAPPELVPTTSSYSFSQPKSFDYSTQKELSRDFISLNHCTLQGRPVLTLPKHHS